jgi:hypothetical protein
MALTDYDIANVGVVSRVVLITRCRRLIRGFSGPSLSGARTSGAADRDSQSSIISMCSSAISCEKFP